MEINANVTNAVAKSISKLNLNTQKHNFEAKTFKNPENTQVSQREKVIPDDNKSKVDVEDIQKYAKCMGENLSIDDINYGLMYGRSVIADCLV